MKIILCALLMFFKGRIPTSNYEDIHSNSKIWFLGIHSGLWFYEDNGYGEKIYQRSLEKKIPIR